jgi:hypothetical protein
LLQRGNLFCSQFAMQLAGCFDAVVAVAAVVDAGKEPAQKGHQHDQNQGISEKSTNGIKQQLYMLSGAACRKSNYALTAACFVLDDPLLLVSCTQQRTCQRRQPAAAPACMMQGPSLAAGLHVAASYQVEVGLPSDTQQQQSGSRFLVCAFTACMHADGVHCSPSVQLLLVLR